MKKLYSLTFVIFLLAMSTGVFLSSQKLLWNDEIYTQLINIEVYSHSDFVKGHTREGNLCPLFYLPQKIFLELAHFKLPFEWKHESCVYEPYSQILMRIPAILYMSLGLALIFHVFARYYHYKAGFLALGLALSNPMVWMYWAEARPYGLWFFLTILQASLLLKMFHKPHSKDWLWLALYQTLLALTIIFSLPQILIVALAAAFLEKTNWKKISLQVIIPIILCYFYYLQAKKVFAWMPTSGGADLQLILQPFTLISLMQVKTWIMAFIPALVPWIWLVPFVLYLLFVKGRILWKEGVYYLLISLGLLLSSVGILMVFSSWISAGITYAVSDRYFIFMIPYVIFTLVLSYIHLLRQNEEPLLRKLIHILYLETVIASALFTLNYLIKWGIF